MGGDVASTRIVVVNKVGQLVGGITFGYKLRLRHLMHRWKGISVSNTIKGLVASFRHYYPKKHHLIPQNGSGRSRTLIFHTGTCQ
jgi:hypothetical protein